MCVIHQNHRGKGSFGVSVSFSFSIRAVVISSLETKLEAASLHHRRITNTREIMKKGAEPRGRWKVDTASCLLIWSVVYGVLRTSLVYLWYLPRYYLW
ncbi:hypothetical protein LY76DRAFT_46709 [Colletotrichum caudatum]|nr:hypothetical protein LY76DRAFT_46709 [Colletotrichum caudatum]